jgi:hypothetical protein
VRGRAEPGGDFVVSDVVWPGIAPQPERPLMDTDKYVALVSGLQLADRKADMMQVRLEGCQSCQGSFSCMECKMACHLYALSGEGPHARWSAACSLRTARQISCGCGAGACVLQRRMPCQQLVFCVEGGTCKVLQPKLCLKQADCKAHDAGDGVESRLDTG